MVLWDSLYMYMISHLGVTFLLSRHSAYVNYRPTDVSHVALHISTAKLNTSVTAIYFGNLLVTNPDTDVV